MTTMTSPAPNTARERWELAENQTMRLPRRRVATVVRVERGTVLVTQQGDYEDHVLEQGDELVVRRSRARRGVGVHRGDDLDAGGGPEPEPGSRAGRARRDARARRAPRADRREGARTSSRTRSPA